MDPDEKILLDSDRFNNGRTREGDPRAAARWTVADRLLGSEPPRLPDGGLVSRAPRTRARAFAGASRSRSRSPTWPSSLWLIQLLLSSVLILPVSNSLHDDCSTALRRGSRMVANPDFGWWETLQREHPDLLGNFPDLAAGLLTPEGVKSSQLGDSAGIGAAAVSLGVPRGRAPRLRARRGLRHAAGAARLARHVRPRGDAALPGLPRSSRWRRSPRRARPTAGSTSRPAKRCATACRSSTAKARRSLSRACGSSLCSSLWRPSSSSPIRCAPMWVARPDLPPISRFFTGVASALGRPARLFGVLLLVRARDGCPLLRLARRSTPPPAARRASRSCR